MTDTLLKKRELITSAILSNDIKKVYFITACEIKNYSPIARKAPHGMDVFEIEIETKKNKKLTNINAYSISSLISTYTDSLICANIYDKNGLVFISTITGKVKEININSPRNEVKQYFEALDIRRDSMIYEAPYELYRYNFITNKNEFILRCPDGKQYGNINPDEAWNNIIFDNYNKTYKYNIKNKKLTVFKFKIH